MQKYFVSISLFLVLASSGCGVEATSVLRGDEAAKHVPSHGKWTYKVVRIDAAQKGSNKLESTLNSLGMRGWELCWISRDGRQAILKLGGMVDGKANGKSAENKVIQLKARIHAQEQSGLIEFGGLIVNLNDERLNRYLRINLVVQVDPSRHQVINDLVDRKREVMKNWLIKTLSDYTLDEVRGKAGQDAIRKELSTGLNTLLGSEPDAIQDVLFTEFNVQ
jgi:flagellar basal body-associated protein FliL